MLERRFGPNYPVLSIAPHYRCSQCDSRDTESRPAPAQTSTLDVDDHAADPSFDASLAALNGLLASVRGGDAPPPSRRTDPPPERPTFTAAPFPLPPLPAFDSPDFDPDADWDLDNPAPLDALPPEEEVDPFDTPPPPPKPARPLEELVADGPADDADPLWEPVSLADMANRHGAAPPPVEEDTDAEDWAPPPPRRHTRSFDNAPEDETLAAMRRFFAEADPTEEEEIDSTDSGSNHYASDRAPHSPRFESERLTRHGHAQDLDDLPLELDEEDAERDSEPVFSHKALVRQDFEDDLEDPDGFTNSDTLDSDSADDDAADSDSANAARRWAENLDEEDEEEPTDAEILAFAIRDPEIRTHAPPQPSPPTPAKAKAERPTRRASAATDGDEEGGFDKTLATLRSMIEDAATEPKPGARRKSKPAPAPDPTLDDLDEASAPDDVPPPPRRSTAKASAKPSASKGGNSKQSAQEREIEEAMKALRDLVEDDEEPPPPAARPVIPPVIPSVASKTALPAADRPLSRPTWEEDDDVPAPPRMANASPLMEEPLPPPRPAVKDAAKDSPLSKTIAALRGMLELDGRKKR